MSGFECSTRERRAKQSFADGVPKPEFGNEIRDYLERSENMIANALKSSVSVFNSERSYGIVGKCWKFGNEDKIWP